MGSEQACQSAKAGRKRAQNRKTAAQKDLGVQEKELAALRASGASTAVLKVKEGSVELARSKHNAALEDLESWENMVSQVCEGPDA